MRHRALVVLGIVALLMSAAGPVGAEEKPDLPIVGRAWNPGDVVIDPAIGGPSASQYKNAKGAICTQTAAFGSVHRTDCEGNAPDNETSIAVNPTDTTNLIAAGNDYQLKASSGGTVSGYIFTRAQVSKDGGVSWTTYPIDYSSYVATGDPAVAFDAAGRAYVATLGFGFGQGLGTLNAKSPDILIATSANGGTTWTKPVAAAKGTGSFFSAGNLNDKEMITAWGDGNAIVTWTLFRQGPHGSYIESPILASVTHDGGATWSNGTEISGSASFCQSFTRGTACNQDQGSWPVVAADGRVYVYFFNGPAIGSTDFDDQVLVVEVDPATGARIAGPFLVSGVEDGSNDLPLAFGRQTAQDSAFRWAPFGNIAADPANPAHLAATWSDATNSPSRDSGATDPYATVTNLDVWVSQSTDRGRTWSTPITVGASTAGDQFYPSVTFTASGKLVVGMMDRSFDAANHAYAFSLSVRNGTWSTTNLSGALSDPTKDNRWFAGTLDPDFPFATSFIGDYNTIVATGETVWSSWTDLRNQTTFGTRTGADEQMMAASKGY
jgi:hypothetical protein